MTDYTRELEVATRLAREAGEAILAIYSTQFRVEYKGADDPVTEADRKANAMIVAGLSRAFPDDAIVAEESLNDPAKWTRSRRIWYVDPLDGTREFVSRAGEFSVMIGLAEDGVSKMGVVYRPTDQSMFSGIYGVGAWIERGDSKHRLDAHSPRSVEPRLILSRSHRTELTERVRSALGVMNYLQAGSVGIKAAMVAEGLADIYFETSSMTCAWDTCAPEAILRAAGGEFSDFLGRPFRYGGTELRNLHGIVATAGNNHSKLISITHNLKQ
jgi:3'(2'), 5'-bisphosphate nucleotidase